MTNGPARAVGTAKKLDAYGTRIGFTADSQLVVVSIPTQYDHQPSRSVIVLRASNGRSVYRSQYERSRGSAAVTRADLSPDNEVVLLYRADNSAAIVNSHTGKEAYRLEQGAPIRASFSSDGLLLALTSANVTKVVNARTGQQLCEVPQTIAHRFSSDGSVLLVSKADGSRWALGSKTGTELCRLGDGDDLSIIFSADSSVAIVTQADRARVIEVRGGRERHGFAVPEKAKVELVGAPDPVIMVLDAEHVILSTSTGTEVCRIASRGTHQPVVHPDGSTLAIEASDGRTTADNEGIRSVRVVNIHDGEEVLNFLLQREGSFKFSPDGTLIAVSGSVKDGSRVLDATTGATRYQMADHLFGFSPDSSFLRGLQRVVVSATGAEVTRIRSSGLTWKSDISSCDAFSPDSTMLATLHSGDRHRWIWMRLDPIPEFT
jgi:WD40 repeat protein